MNLLRVELQQEAMANLGYCINILRRSPTVEYERNPRSHTSRTDPRAVARAHDIYLVVASFQDRWARS